MEKPPLIFKDSWKRIERAIAHGDAFKAEWQRVVDPNLYATSIEMNSDWTSGIAKAVARSPPENDMALELGEFFYQLRAALDAAVYQIAVFEQGIDPPANEDRIEFPINHKPSGFENSAVNKGPFPKELRNWIEKIQPYNANQTANTQYSTLNAALTILHDCARKDRHRRLHVVAAVPTGGTVGFSYSPGVKITNFKSLPVNFLNGESIFLSFGVEGICREGSAKIQLNTNIIVEVSIDEIAIPAGGNLGVQLERLVEATRFVLTNLEDGYNGIGFSL